MKGTPETPQCGFSRASIQILGLEGVDPAKFTAFNVLEDESLRQGPHAFSLLLSYTNWPTLIGIKEYSEWPTIPQLYVDKEFVGGCDILVAMHQNGELSEMLQSKKVLISEELDSSKKAQEWFDIGMNYCDTAESFLYIPSMLVSKHLPHPSCPCGLKYVRYPGSDIDTFSHRKLAVHGMCESLSPII
jgi:glutaredoxin-related protein